MNCLLFINTTTFLSAIRYAWSYKNLLSRPPYDHIDLSLDEKHVLAPIKSKVCNNIRINAPVWIFVVEIIAFKATGLNTIDDYCQF